MFDNGHGHFTIYNLSRYSDSFYTPGASFEILMSLVAVQTGVAKDENSSISESLDSMQAILHVPGPRSLQECFRDTSATGRLGFMELGVQRLAHDTLKKWVDSLQYGNKRMSRKDSAGVFREDEMFWDDGALQINSDEQLGLLKKLYFNQLPFFERTQGIVRRMMPAESNSAYRFTYKTAQATTDNGHAVGWVMGWVEENKHPYFFVLNLESADPTKDLRRTGLVIAKEILQDLGLFKGKK